MRKGAFVIMLPAMLLGWVGPAPGDEAWPPRDLLVRSIAEAVEGILNSQDPETGRFGTEPWICSDQNVLFPLAAAWAMEHPDNPWHHDPRVLEAVCKGGEALVDDQDERGMWTFRKKDHSTWGQIHMPWTYSRWIRAYLLVRDAMPADMREKWEQGLLLGFTGIRRYADGGVHNIPTHHAMALYIAGVCFDNEDWREAATRFMAKAVDKQDPTGFWSEHFGPVVGYNRVYVEALGIYYAFSQDETVLGALQRAARFHSAVLWPDGSSVAAIDERQLYGRGRDIGNIGFSWTREGRGFLLAQTAEQREAGRLFNADWAAAMLLYGGEGAAVLPPAAGDRGRAVLGDNDALIQRDRPWAWCFSAYACPPINNRWIQDRHNLVDVFHDEMGLVIGGGNTKLQPYWSSFTVGDPALLAHTPGDEAPNFVPQIDLLWTPSEGRVDAERPLMSLRYGEVRCGVEAEPREDGALALHYRVEAVGGRRVEAHVPLMRRPGKLRLDSGEVVVLAEEELLRTAEEAGGGLTWSDMRVTLPAGSSLMWPARQHNPYTKDGRASPANAKLVVVLPFAEDRREHTLTLSHAPPPPFDGLAFEARELPCVSETGTRMKPLDDLGSQFLGATGPGESMTFTLPAVAPGRYELLLEFVRFPGYGIARVLVNGAPVGEPFDAWAPELDGEGERVSFGVVELGAREHTVMVQLTGKREEATGHFISVKRVLLRSAGDD